MSASFVIQLDTTPPAISLSSINRSSGSMVVFYDLTEAGDAVATLEPDDGDTIYFDDEGDRVVAAVPWYVGGVFSIRGRDEVWNSVVQSFRTNPLPEPSGDVSSPPPQD